MKRINSNWFLLNRSLFNRQTLEVICLNDDYYRVLKNMFSGKRNSEDDKQIVREINEQLKVNSSLKCVASTYSPRFVAFRIVLGELCNLKCEHCFVLKREHTPQKMNYDLLRKILVKTFNFGTNHQLKYHFFGGEPLMMFDLMQAAVKQINKAVNDGIIIKPILTITSNGLLINNQMAEYFKQHDMKIGISLDGPQIKNDAIRGQGVYEKVIESFLLLTKHEVDHWFLITPYADILEEMPVFLEYLASNYSFQTITFNTPFNGETLEWIVDGKRYASILLECYRVAKRYGFNIESAASPVFNALSSYHPRAYPCSISDREVMGSITHDGRISFCAQYWGEDLFPQEFLIESQLSFEVNKLSHCQQCPAENICGGPCLISYAKTGKADLNKCNFYNHLLEKFLADPHQYLSDEQIMMVDV